ncbi:DUF5133 domain-containing protein [Streptomyces sp. NPDC047085]|uniref:DUF5133 domain-containing protein n=1 Tax=Streptomyces sp. NPDC047085 TaxID=3155140 RepID=UPI0034006751
MLLPHLRTLARALRAYRVAQARVLRDPANPIRHRQLEDAAYTLCVLMDRRSATAAAARAERLLADALAGRAPERAGPETPAVKP